MSSSISKTKRIDGIDRTAEKQGEGKLKGTSNKQHQIKIKRLSKPHKILYAVELKRY